MLNNSSNDGEDLGFGEPIDLSADGNTLVVGSPPSHDANRGNSVGAAWVSEQLDGVW